ncbi:MAG: N-acetylmuramoyl-L-alanine amidase [Bacteroidales bacterium]|jgi:N-acetylmuramoyl-L-alanine amidase|nr:N-acetylmuramoyl-L-alanine amidase [Bacteroidales bacterium]
MIKKILIYSIVLLSQIILFNGELFSQAKLKSIVIDPGHGGADPGAVGKFSKEKDVVLIISKKFGDYISKNFSDVTVIYTRTDDSYSELYKRAKMANDKNADLFISVHANSFNTNGPYGFETYLMGISKNEANLQVAKFENSVILQEKDYLSNYDGFNPNNPETNIIFSLYQNVNIHQSTSLCQIIQNNAVKELGRFDRGVKQAGFWVLWKTTMPSILVELGFISNPDEEKYLNSEVGQENLARMLYNSFVEYKSNFDEITYDKKMPYLSESISDIYSTETVTTTTTSPITTTTTNTTNETIPNTPTSKPTSTNTTNVKTTQTTVETSTKDLPKDENDTKIQFETDQIIYKIQIYTSASKLNLSSSVFKGYPNVKEYFHEGLYKYTIGEETDYNKIYSLWLNIKKDFPKSWILRFKNGERIK